MAMGQEGIAGLPAIPHQIVGGMAAIAFGRMARPRRYSQFPVGRLTSRSAFGLKRLSRKRPGTDFGKVFQHIHGDHKII